MPTISTPYAFDNGIDDDTFAKIVACIRDCRSLYGHDCFHQRKSGNAENVYCISGVSQISGGSRTSVGGYYEKEAEEDNPHSLTSAITAHWMKS